MSCLSTSRAMPQRRPDRRPKGRAAGNDHAMTTTTFLHAWGSFNGVWSVERPQQTGHDAASCGSTPEDHSFIFGAGPA
jgi:hypothetical protein